MIRKNKNKRQPKKRVNLINARRSRYFLDEKGELKPWTQKYVADLILLNFGKIVTPQHIGMLERGQNNPSYEMAMILSKLYQCRPEELFNMGGLKKDENLCKP